jgi:putative hydrolase
MSIYGGYVMIQLIADVHTHTIASGHAYGTIREMAQAASEKHLQILGISEHAPGVPGTVDPIYFSNLEVIPRELYGVQMIHGSEINVLNDGTLSLAQEFMDKLDYAIVGIHRLCYEDQGREQNTKNLIQCMKNKKVRFVSHPDDDHTPLNYEQLVLAAKEYHVALEVNNSSLIKKDRRLNCYENYKSMLNLCDRYQVPIIINSDAHDPYSVGNFNLAIKLIEDLNFDKNLILNTEYNNIMEFLCN